MTTLSPITDIILLGPIRAGKSTIGRLLAEALNAPQISLDALCWDYYREIGFDQAGAEKLGPDGMIAARFLVHAIERLLVDHRECVIDFGGGHSALSDEAALNRAQELLANYPNVFLLLPSPDPARSDAILAQRNLDNSWLQDFVKANGWNPNEAFLRHPANRALAKQTVYTEDRSPEETRDEILSRLEHRPKARGRGTRTKQKSETIEELRQVLQEAEESHLQSVVFITATERAGQWQCRLAKQSHLQSVVLITATAEGGVGCWARIAEEHRAEICEQLAQLSQDIECR